MEKSDSKILLAKKIINDKVIKSRPSTNPKKKPNLETTIKAVTTEDLEKSGMLENRSIADGTWKDTKGKIQPYQYDEKLSLEQRSLFEYIAAIVYRLIDSDETLKSLDIDKKISLYLSGFDNACIATDSHKNLVYDPKDTYSLIFGPKLFDAYQKMHKTFTEDDIAAVLAHELGHILDRIELPGVQGKANETAADIFAVKLLQKAGYNPGAVEKFFNILAENEKEADGDSSKMWPILISLEDPHMTMENRALTITGYLLQQSRFLGIDIKDRPLTPIRSNIDYFKIAQTFVYQTKNKETEEETENPLTKKSPIDIALSYEEALKNLQRDFNPKNLAILLTDHYHTKESSGIYICGMHSFKQRPDGRYRCTDVPFEQKIKDILETCDYKKIYEDNPNVDPKLLENARIFIDLITKPSKEFQFPEHYCFNPLEYDSCELPGFILDKNEKKRQFYVPYQNGKPVPFDVPYGETTERIFSLLPVETLLNEHCYANLTTEELVSFRREGIPFRHYYFYIKNFLETLIIKRIMSENDDEKKLSLLLPLLTADKSFSEYQTRQIYIQITAALLAKKYGPDDGTTAYMEKVEKEVLTPHFLSSGIDVYPEKILDSSLAKEILDEFSQRIVSKRKLSVRINELIDCNNRASLRRFNLAAQSAAEATMEGILSTAKAPNAILDFLTHDYDIAAVYNYLQDNILEQVDSGVKKKDLYYAKKAQREAKNFGECADKLYQLHTMFWNSDLEYRTVVLTKVLKSSGQNSENLFSYAIEKLIPPKVKNRQFLIDIVGAFIASYKEEYRPFLLAAMLSAQKKQNSSTSFSVGEPLKEFLENMGPAGIKLGQAIGSSPAADNEIRETMQKMKHSSAQPTRRGLYALYDCCVPMDQQKELGEIKGAGSYFIAVESADGKSVYSLLRENARDRANAEFERMLFMCKILRAKKEEKYVTFARIFEGIVNKANTMSDIETDLDVGKCQDRMARQIYCNDDGSEKVLNLEDGIQATLHVAKWNSFGEKYKETEKVEGEHFNDFPDAVFKHHFAKAYLQLELENLFSGCAFDHDRHGAQMKIQKVDNTHYNVGLFDNGAMSDAPPSPEEQKQLGRVLNKILNGLPNPKNPIEVLRYFASTKKGFAEKFNDAVQEETKNGEASDYLLAVQRGILALNDYMRCLSTGEVLSVITTSLKNVQATNANGLTNSAIVSEISEANMGKLDNLVKHFSKEKKKIIPAPPKIALKRKETTETVLRSVVKRIKKNMTLSNYDFTFSRDQDILARKLGLSIATRSRLARLTDSLVKFRKDCFKIGGPFFVITGSIIGTMLGSTVTIMPLSSWISAETALGIFTTMAAISAAFCSGISFSNLSLKNLFKGRAARKIFSLAQKTKEKDQANRSNLRDALYAYCGNMENLTNPIGVSYVTPYAAIKNNTRKKVPKKRKNMKAALSTARNGQKSPAVHDF